MDFHTYRVAFFGHRAISDCRAAERALDFYTQKLITEHPYVEFLVGRNGEFDQLAAAAVRRAKRQIRGDNSALVLVLHRETAELRDNRDEFLRYYDEIEICPEAEAAYPKAAIGIRNRLMAQRADLILCWLERESGGAADAVRYARKIGRECRNLADFAKDMPESDEIYANPSPRC